MHFLNSRTIPPAILLAILLSVLLLMTGTEQKLVAAGATIDVKDVRPGMKGHGLTVFSGTEPEKFDVEVIDVVPNFLLRQNIILIRCKHPVTDKAGVIGGMSGSPIFLEGRLAGALAYGWKFTIEPIAGVTPIANMQAVLKRKVRTPSVTTAASELLSMLDPRKALPTRQEETFFTRHQKESSSQLLPTTTPLSISGFSARALQIIEETVSPFGMVPMQGGGSGADRDARDPKKFVPGGPLGVQLIRGDMSATGIGTVTTVVGDDVLAFGHPMMNMGEVLFPVTTARIHTVIASVMRSNKLGSPLSEIGSLTQDRNACIAARTDRRASMIPVRITVDTGEPGVDDTYEVEVVSHRLLTDRLIHAALFEVLQTAASDAEDVTADVEGILKIKGRPPVLIADSGVSRSGILPLSSYLRPAILAGAVLANPFENVEIESLELRLKVRYGLAVSTISSIYVTSQEPAPGDTVNLNIRLVSFGGKERIMTVPLTIPEEAENQKLQVTVGGGDFVTPALAVPENLDDLLANVQRLHPSRSIVVDVAIASESVSMRGALMENLPGSAVFSLKPLSGVENMNTFRTSHTGVHRTDELIIGKETLTISVGSRRKP